MIQPKPLLEHLVNAVAEGQGEKQGEEDKQHYSSEIVEEKKRYLTTSTVQLLYRLLLSSLQCFSISQPCQTTEQLVAL